MRQEESASEKKKVFVFPRLIPVFIAAAVILICGTYVMNFISDRSIQNLAMSICDKDINMLQDLDLTQDLDIIENIQVLEEFKVIDFVEL